MGGLGKLASVGTKMAVSNAGFFGAGMVGSAGAKAIDGVSEAAAKRLDGIDRHPDEGFGIVDGNVGARSRDPLAMVKEKSKVVLKHGLI